MSLDVERIRKDFRCLSPAKGSAPIYFDSACVTLKPRPVIDAMMSYYDEHPSCHKRAVHAFGKETTRRMAEARNAIKRYLNAGDSGEFVFTRNTTEAINLVANSLPLRRGDAVITTDAEHNSNLLPWQFLQKKQGVQHRMIPVAPNGSYDLAELEKALALGKVKLVSVFHTSHVTGLSLPIGEIAQLAHAAGALLLVDAAQALPHHRTDVRALDIDFLAVSFHKAFGPSGMGGLYGKHEQLDRLLPFLVGGETVDDVDYDSCTLSGVPERFEAGLQDYAGVFGSAAAIAYLEMLGAEQIRAHEQQLNELISDGLAHHRGAVSILGPKEPMRRGAIINLRIEGIDAGELSILLDKTSRIMVRAGVHCCHAWYRKHKLPATLRVSLSAYNTVGEAKVFVDTMNSLLSHFV